MKPEQFIREQGLEKARSLLEQRNRFINVEKPTHHSRHNGRRTSA